VSGKEESTFLGSALGTPFPLFLGEIYFMTVRVEEIPQMTVKYPLCFGEEGSGEVDAYHLSGSGRHLLKDWMFLP